MTQRFAPEGQPGDIHVITPTADFVAAVAGTYMLAQTNGGTAFASGAAGTARAAFYLDPARYVVQGRVTKVALRLVVMTNSIAPAITFTLQLYSLTGTTGGASVAPGVSFTTAVAGLSAAVASPPAGGITSAVSADVNIPAANGYVLAVVLSGNMAATSTCCTVGQLFVRRV